MSKEEKLRRERALKLRQMIENAESLEEIEKIEKEIEEGGYYDIFNEEDKREE